MMAQFGRGVTVILVNWVEEDVRVAVHRILLISYKVKVSVKLLVVLSSRSLSPHLASYGRG